MKITKEQVQFSYDLAMEVLAAGGNVNILYDKLSNNFGDMDEIDKKAAVVTSLSVVAGLIHLQATTTNNKKYLAFSAALNGEIAYQSAELVGMQIAAGKY